MKPTIINVIICVIVSTITQFSFADDTDTDSDMGTDTDTTPPFVINIEDIIVQGNGCPEGTYSVALSPDGTELSVLYSAFTAETDATHFFDFANCNIAIPIDVPDGITINLLGIDYRGLALIPSGGTGTLSRDYFFAGTQGPHLSSSVDIYDMFYQFYYSDEIPFEIWSECGDDVIARSNVTIFVTRPIFNSPGEAMMTLFSIDYELSVLFHLEWEHCPTQKK